MIRKPVVAGKFYSASRKMLEKEVAGYADPKAKKQKVLGCVSPHAGYMYSGPVAGAVLSMLEPADTYIILGPNHSGLGKSFGLDTSEKWQTPFGEVEIDKGLAGTILKNSEYIEKDRDSHLYEHSLEVQVPFLQYLQKDFKIVPVVISYGNALIYKAIGKEIATSIKEEDRRICIIASSDMTHYEPHESAKEKDKKVIDKILDLDIDGFLETIAKYNISMCGYAPTAIMLAACIELGAKKAELVKYQTSGDTSGDYSTVVGYAGILVS